MGGFFEGKGWQISRYFRVRQIAVASQHFATTADDVQCVHMFHCTQNDIYRYNQRRS
jgi:hypothetical protein